MREYFVNLSGAQINRSSSNQCLALTHNVFLYEYGIFYNFWEVVVRLPIDIYFCIYWLSITVMKFE